MDAIKNGIVDLFSCGAVSGRIAGELDGGALEAKPCLDSADDLPAGTSRREHLAEKGPEGDRETVMALAAMVAFIGGSQQGLRHEESEGSQQIADRTEAFDFLEQSGESRLWRPAEEERAESFKEGSGVTHRVCVYIRPIDGKHKLRRDAKKQLQPHSAGDSAAYPTLSAFSSAFIPRGLDQPGKRDARSTRGVALDSKSQSQDRQRGVVGRAGTTDERGDLQSPAAR